MGSPLPIKTGTALNWRLFSFSLTGDFSRRQFESKIQKPHWSGEGEVLPDKETNLGKLKPGKENSLPDLDTASNRYLRVGGRGFCLGAGREAARSQKNACKSRRLPHVRCTLCWAVVLVSPTGLTIITSILSQKGLV
jgi:hypothetical protein